MSRAQRIIRRGKVAFCAALVLLAMVPASAFAGTYVLDEANIIDAETEARIEALSARVEAATPGAEIAVVTVEALGDASIEEYAEQRFETLGVGDKKANNGILLVVAPNDRRVRIEVGYGLEGALPDALAGDIIDVDLTPRFKDGDYSGGIEAGHARLAGIVAKEYSVDIEGASTAAPVTDITESPLGIAIGLLMMALIIGAFIFIVIRSRGGGGGWPGIWMSGGGSDGDSGGGGFGGGDSGGGGASGDW